MPVISTTKMTARQFLMLGEDPPGVRLELVDGEIAVSPGPMPKHSFVEKMLSFILMKHIEDHDLGLLLGNTDTIFGVHDVRRPDLIYFTKAREHLVLADQAIDGPPDLCVEILSPSSITIDRSSRQVRAVRARRREPLLDRRPRSAIDRSVCIVPRTVQGRRNRVE